MSSRGRFATPADFPLQDCSPYSHVHVRRERLGFVPRSRTILCRPVPNPLRLIRNCISVRRTCETYGVSSAMGLMNSPRNSRISQWLPSTPPVVGWFSSSAPRSVGQPKWFRAACRTAGVTRWNTHAAGLSTGSQRSCPRSDEVLTVEVLTPATVSTPWAQGSNGGQRLVENTLLPLLPSTTP
jgi:hypothetical protein